MSIGLVSQSSYNTHTSSASIAVSSLGITLPTAANQLFVLVFCLPTSSSTLPSINSLSVPAGETATWSITGSTSVTSSAKVYFCWIYTTMSWTGASITGTGSNAVTNNGRTCSAAVFSGLSGTVSGAINTANGTPWSVTAGSGPTAGDLVIGAIAERTAAAVYTATAFTSEPPSSTDISENHCTTGATAASIISYAIYDGTNKTYTASLNAGADAAIAFAAPAFSASATAALAGDGALTASVVPASSAAAALAGSGALAASATPASSATAALAGDGALSYVTGFAAVASLAGDGGLATIATPALSSSAGLAGSGGLGVVAAPSLASAQALGGSGTLAVAVVAALSVGVDLAGVGALSAPIRTSISLSGVGALAISSAVVVLTQTVNFGSSSTESVADIASDSITTTGGGGGGGGGVAGELQVVILDTTIRRAPTSITVMVSGGQPELPVTFRMDAGLTPSGQADAYTTNLDTEGGLNATSLDVTDVLGGQQGSRVLTVVQGGISATATYSVALVPMVWPAVQGLDAQAVTIPEALVGDVQHWVLQDLLAEADGGIGSYVLPYNPRTMSSPHLEHAIKSKHTTSHEGQFHFFQGGNIPKEWSWSGYVPTEEIVAALKAFRALNRRFYVIDHHNRAWKVVFTNLDVVPRLRHVFNGEVTDWGSDYTVTATIVDQDWVTPA